MNFEFKSFSFKYLVFACLLVLVLVVSLNVVSAIDSVPNQTIPDVISDDAVSFDYVNQNLLINGGSNYNSDVNLNEVSLLSTNDEGVNSNSNDSQLNNQTDSLQQDFSSQSIIVNEEKSVCDESEAGSDSSGLSVNSSSIFNLNSSVDNSSFVGSSSLSDSSNSSFVGSSSLSDSSNSSFVGSSSLSDSSNSSFVGSSSLSGSFNSSVFNNTIYNATFDDGHFTISGVNGSVSGHAFVVSCEDDLNIVSKYLYDFNNKDEYIWVNFIENVNLNIIPYNSTLLFNSGHILIINGNGATVNIKKSQKFKSLFLLNDYQNSVYISNLTVNGFDRGVVNYGGLDLDCVCFSDSSISGVINYAQLSCENSSFKSNVGSSGAIYADTSSINKLINCYFVNNSIDVVNNNASVVIYRLNGFNGTVKKEDINGGFTVYRNNLDSYLNLTYGYPKSKDKYFLFDNKLYKRAVPTEIGISDIAKKIGNVDSDDGVIVNFEENTIFSLYPRDFSINKEDYDNSHVSFLSNGKYVFEPRKLLVINGNGCTFIKENFQINDEYHFLYCGKGVTVVINNLTLIGFNTAIFNYGNMILNNVTFKDNKLKYIHMKDYGGAIHNYGHLSCIDCSFINNYAKYGGAIFSNGTGTVLNLTNCNFTNNTAYKKDGDSGIKNWFKSIEDYVYHTNQSIFLKGGDNVFVGGNSIVYIYNSNINTDNMGYDNTNMIISFKASLVPVVREYKVYDAFSLYDLSRELKVDNGRSTDMYIVNVTDDINITPWDKYLFRINAGTLIITGNGSINVINPKEDNEFSFAYVNVYSSLYVSNLRVSGFNCAIWNYGYVNLNNMTFLNNKLKYLLHDDQAGCICNFGILKCVNCTFKGNKGNWGGAIYSAHGARAFITECTFEDNVANDKNGGDIYNFNYGQSTIINAGGSCSNFKIATGYLPPKWKADVAEIGNVIVSIASGTIISFIAGPNVGAIVGTCVGTFIGTSLHLYIDLDNAKKTQHYDSYIFKSIPLNVLNQFLWASTGAGLTNVNSKAGVKKENNINLIKEENPAPENLKRIDITRENDINQLKEMANNRKIKENNLKNFKWQASKPDGSKLIEYNPGEITNINKNNIFNMNEEDSKIINEIFKGMDNCIQYDIHPKVEYVDGMLKHLGLEEKDPGIYRCYDKYNKEVYRYEVKISKIESNGEKIVNSLEVSGKDNSGNIFKKNWQWSDNQVGLKDLNDNKGHVTSNIEESNLNENNNKEPMKESMEDTKVKKSSNKFYNIDKINQEIKKLDNDFKHINSLDITKEKDIDNIMNIFTRFNKYKMKMNINTLSAKFKNIGYSEIKSCEQSYKFSENGNEYELKINNDINHNNVKSISWIHKSDGLPVKMKLVDKYDIYL